MPHIENMAVKIIQLADGSFCGPDHPKSIPLFHLSVDQISHFFAQYFSLFLYLRNDKYRKHMRHWRILQ